MKIRIKAFILALALSLALPLSTWAESIPTPNTGTSGGSGTVVTNAGTFVVQEDGASLTAVQSLDTKLPAQGAAVTASSTPVNIASDQTVPISAASLPLPSGAATDATLDGMQSDIQAITKAEDSGILNAVELGSFVMRDDVLEADGAVNQELDVMPVRADNFGSAWSALTADDGVRIPADSTAGLKIDLGGDNDVVLTAGLLHADSPTTEVASLDLFNGAGETQIAATNFGASKAISITGTGKITKVCVTTSLNTPHAEDMTLYFFDADPSITIEDADWPSVAVAETVVATISLAEVDFDTSKALALVNCQDVNETFHSITHVVFSHDGTTTYDDNDIVLHLWYRRNS